MPRIRMFDSIQVRERFSGRGQMSRGAFFPILLAATLSIPQGELSAQAEPAPISPWWSEGRVGADFAWGSGMFLASGLIGTRPLGGQAGPWVRVSFVGLSLHCPMGAVCETEAWSLGAGADLVVLRWDWGLTSVSAGWRGTFWET